MAMLNKLRLRLKALFFKPRLEEELDEEVRFHLEREIEENIVRGMTPEEARYAAIRSFGGVERVKEESRDVWGVRLVEELWQDLRYGARMLLKRPGFTVVAVITLGLGIGANTTMFSAINGLLLRPMPFKDPELLVHLDERALKAGFESLGVSFPDFADWRARSRSFERMALYEEDSFTLASGTATERAERVDGARVTAS